PPSLSPPSLHRSSHGARRPLHSFPTRRSSDLGAADRSEVVANGLRLILLRLDCRAADTVLFRQLEFAGEGIAEVAGADPGFEVRSEEHTSELSHVSISYAVFCLKKKMEILYRH